MYYDESISRERNDRINKIIRLIQTAEAKNEIINKTTLQKEDIGSSATLGRELSRIGDEGEQIITFDKHKLTFRMKKTGNLQSISKLIHYQIMVRLEL